MTRQTFLLFYMEMIFHFFFKQKRSRGLKMRYVSY